MITNLRSPSLKTRRKAISTKSVSLRLTKRRRRLTHIPRLRLLLVLLMMTRSRAQVPSMIKPLVPDRTVLISKRRRVRRRMKAASGRRTRKEIKRL
jgi:hypothetical protein